MEVLKIEQPTGLFSKVSRFFQHGTEEKVVKKVVSESSHNGTWMLIHYQKEIALWRKNRGQDFTKAWVLDLQRENLAQTVTRKT